MSCLAAAGQPAGREVRIAANQYGPARAALSYFGLLRDFLNVPNSYSWTWRPRRRHGGGRSLGRGVPEDKYAQAFPSFGSERMGAPVVSFCRIDDKEIRLREPIAAPDALIVQDVTLFKAIDVLQGLKENGYLLVNTNQSFAICISTRSSPSCRPAMPSRCRRPNSRSNMSAARCRTRRCSAPSRR